MPSLEELPPTTSLLQDDGHIDDELTSPSAVAAPPKCGICQLSFARYSCPTCSVPYCSVSCFRSQQRHLQCSESFYKANILQQQQQQQENILMASGDVRRQTQEMLVRFEKEVGRRRRPPPPYEGGFDDNDSDEDGNIGDEEEEDQDLAERLAGLDLDNAKPDDILNRLTPSEIAQFKAFITTATANNNNNNNNNSNRFYDDNDVVDSSNDGATAESHDQLQKHQQLKRMHSQLINSLVWQPWWYSISDPAKERQRHVSRNLIVDLGPSSSSSSSSCSSNNSSSEPDPSSFRPKLDHQYQSSSNTLPDSLYDKLFANVPISSSFSHNVIGSSSLVPSPWPQPLDSTTISVPPASNLCKSSSSSRVAEPSLLLTHNLIDILFAYVVTLRHFDGSFSLSPQGSSSSSSADPLHHQLQQQQLQELEAAQHILHLSRTLGRNDAASLYPSVEDACASLSSYLSNNNFTSRHRIFQPGSFNVLYSDLVRLTCNIEATRVALADLYRLFEGIINKQQLSSRSSPPSFLPEIMKSSSSSIRKDQKLLLQQLRTASGKVLFHSRLLERKKFIDHVVCHISHQLELNQLKV